MAPPLIPRAFTAPQLYSSASSSPRASSSSLPTFSRRAAVGGASAPLLGTRHGSTRILAAVGLYTLVLLLGLALLYSGLHRYGSRSSAAADNGGGGALPPGVLERALSRRSALERGGLAELWPPSAVVTPNVEFNDAGARGTGGGGKCLPLSHGCEQLQLSYCTDALCPLSCCCCALACRQRGFTP